MRTAIVTGGTRGIGAAVVDGLLRAEGDWRVLCVARHVGNVAHHPNITFISGDLSTAEGIAAVTRAVCEQAEVIDLIVNNAGAISDTDALHCVDDRAVVGSFRLHCAASLLLSNSLKARLELAEGSSIINVGSIYGSVADPDVTAYALAKSAIPELTRIMARAFAPKIRVNCVLPGHVDTDMTRGAPDEFVRSIVARTPLQRLGTVAEIANAILFLASRNAGFITGASLVIDGGYMIGPAGV